MMHPVDAVALLLLIVAGVLAAHVEDLVRDRESGTDDDENRPMD